MNRPVKKGERSDEKERAVGSKIKFALAAVFVVTVLSTMTLLFVQGVKKQLWNNR